MGHGGNGAGHNRRTATLEDEEEEEEEEETRDECGECDECDEEDPHPARRMLVRHISRNECGSDALSLMR